MKKDILSDPTLRKKYEEIKKLNNDFNKKLKDAGINETVKTIKGNS